jgi:hypothetical protein
VVERVGAVVSAMAIAYCLPVSAVTLPRRVPGAHHGRAEAIS